MMTLGAKTRIAIKTILYATDFSECSEAAGPYVRDLARLYGSEIIVAHVSTPVPVNPELGVVLDPELVQTNLKRALANAAKPFNKLPHRTLLLEGNIWRELSKVVSEEAVDLIVLGTHGRTGLDRMAMGSVAEEIFRQARCPVLTIGPSTLRHPLSHQVHALTNRRTYVESNVTAILYATDFSEESLAAAPFAVSLAQEHQAKLVLLHTVEDSRHDYSKDPVRILNHLVTELKQLVPADAELWCEPEFLVDFGKPADRILEVAEEMKADLIVMGVRGAANHLGRTTHFGGTTAHTVVTEAKCPVLTVLGSA